MEWYYAEDKQQKGPVNAEQFAELVRTGIVKSETLVWREGMTNWQPYGQVVANVSGQIPPPPSAVAPAPSVITPAFKAIDGGRERALSMVKAPAIALIVYAAISVGWLGLQALGMVVEPDYRQMSGIDPEAAEMAKQMRGPMMVGMLGGGVVSVILIFLGAFRMLNLKNYGLAMTGAIAAFLPCICPCCLLGIPLGIWALVVLNNADVKNHFD
ncbi:MAG TPA: DUF4339 domain-containing protein [Verrucomicrobiae bacterium]